MNKKIFTLTAIILLTALAFTACGKQTSEEYFTDLDKNSDKSYELLADAKTYLGSAEAYTYTVNLYSEQIANYNVKHLTMPAEIYTCPECKAVFYGKEYDECPTCGNDDITNEMKKWYKPTIDYTYTKVGNDFYARVDYTDHVYDDEGMPVYSEKTALSKSKLLYAETVSAEVWYVGGSITLRDNDGDAVKTSVAMDFLTDILTSAGSTPTSFNLLASYLDMGLSADKNAVFQTETSNLIGKHVTMLQTYEVQTGCGTASYRTSNGVKVEDENKSDGSYNSSSADTYGENLSFNWGNGVEEVSSVNITTVSVTVKNKSLISLEFYTEKIGAYNNIVTQIWDKKEVIKWNGARIGATKAVFNVEYGTRRHPITLPQQ